jgi:serine/threonine-protein kinase RsbW
VPDPTAEENLEIPSGRGVMLMRAYMSEVEYLGAGNRMRMVFRRTKA